MNPKLVIVSAPSGAGKTTLCQRLLQDFDELTLSISCTTRAPRGQERHGREYFFLAKDDFESKIAAGHFAEWAQVHGNYYGTSREVIEAAFAAGKSVLLDIDVQGAESLRTAFPGRSFAVFVSPPSLAVLEQRLRARGTEKEDAIQRRLANARAEMAEASKFDLLLINDDLDRAYGELRERIRQELRAPGREGTSR